MRAHLPAPIAAVTLALAACSAGNGPGIAGAGSGATRSYPVSGFTAIDLRGSDDIDVRVGTGFSVRAEGPAKALDKLRIAREGDTLRVGRVGSGFSWGEDEQVTVYVTMPRIVAADSAGSGSIRIDRIEGERFRGAIAGSGDLAVGALSTSRAELSIHGSGAATLKGNVGALALDVAGSGDIDAAGLKASSADVSVAGSGSVKANVVGPATVSASGSGDVDLGAGARCTTSKSGSGEVTCGG